MKAFFDTIVEIFSSPQIQAAFIAAAVSLMVALLTVRKQTQDRKFQRADWLLRFVYGPLDTALRNGSLYEYVLYNRAEMEANRPHFNQSIIPLIDEALEKHFQAPSFPVPAEYAKKDASEAALGRIDATVRPLVTKQVERLRQIISKMAG